jgi:hypothetical protein
VTTRTQSVGPYRSNVLLRPHYAGPRRIVGAATEPPAGQRLLAAFGLGARPPPRRHGTADNA